MMGRPCTIVSETKLRELHKQGFTDQIIALKLKTSRATIARRRQQLGLKPNREVGERGIAIKEEEAYWLLVRRSLPYIGRYLQEAAHDYYEETGDWDRYFITMVLEPKAMFHPIPGPYAADPNKMNWKNIKYITDFEQMIDHVGLAGVPGPAVLELMRIYKKGDLDFCKELARQAVETAGFVRVDSMVLSVAAYGCMPPEKYREYWEEQQLIAMDWTPIKHWGEKKKTIIKTFANYSSGTGKKSKTGRIRTIENTQAFLGAIGY
jgi:hypothetical protein